MADPIVVKTYAPANGGLEIIHDPSRGIIIDTRTPEEKAEAERRTKEKLQRAAEQVKNNPPPAPARRRERR